MYCFITLICSALLFSTADGSPRSATIELCNNMGHASPCVYVPLEDEVCFGLSDYYWAYYAVSINTYGHCVRLYAGQNCSDRSITVQPGSPCHYNLGGCGLDFAYKTVSLMVCD